MSPDPNSPPPPSAADSGPQPPLVSDLAPIPARSGRQAMDWSLVLVSEGIEPTIEMAPDGSWWLLVEAPDGERARTALELYQLENRRWPWRREVRSGLYFDWGSLSWVLLLALFFGLSEGAPALRGVGLMDSAAVSRGEWWRLFTAIWLHADIGHLASNAALGVVLLGLAMGRYGTGAGLLAACLAGAGGNLGVWLLSSGPSGSLGASGLVMGCLGLLAAQSIAPWYRLSARRARAPNLVARSPHTTKQLIVGLLGGVMLFVLLGLNPETDVRAHLGGFVTGLILGGLCSAVPKLARRAGLNFACGFMFALLVLYPWWLGLRHGG